MTVDPTADTTVEPDETVVLTVTSGTGYSIGAPASATGTISNDDVSTVTVDVSPASIAEDAGRRDDLHFHPRQHVGGNPRADNQFQYDRHRECR